MDAAREELYILVDCRAMRETGSGRVNANELRKFLAARGCTFETHRGGSGHLTVRRGDRVSQIPVHGSRKELGTGLVNRILKQLDLK